MKQNNTSAFLIAAPKSNSGKTMVSLALMQTLVKRRITVQPFKCGPDYIDPMYHAQISGRASYNLDSWMASGEHVRSVFCRKLPRPGVVLVEGVMGLFDGACKDEGSSAEIARLLGIPVILVVDAASMAYSAAPLLSGFRNFDKRLRIAGVIFNKVNGESHYRFLKEAAEDAGVEPLGYLPRDERLTVQSRHLGLHLPGENSPAIIETASELVEKHVAVDRLLKLTEWERTSEPENHFHPQKQITIALACDDAFNFTYAINLDVLEQMGKVVRFSPLVDAMLPDADLLWLPGGYPELFSRQLAGNTAMRKAVSDFVENGKPVIAECGGMMYLGREIIGENGVGEEMCGIFNFATTFQDKKLHLGYRKIELGDFALKGHEFHYSHLICNEEAAVGFKVKNAREITVDMPVFRYKNCWASYIHLYLGEEGKMEQFINFIIDRNE